MCYSHQCITDSHRPLQIAGLWPDEMQPIGEALQTQGYCVIKQLITAEELAVLRKESDVLFAPLHGDADKHEACGCALDFISEQNIPENDASRLQEACYLQRRWCNEVGISPQHRATVQKLLFDTLPHLVRDAESCSYRADDTADAAAPCICLFNEQYICKPPNSAINFRWHTDADEQLQMIQAISGSDIVAGKQLPLYYSFWIALDDCDARNGCLRVLPHANNDAQLTEPPSDSDNELCGIELPVSAGDAVMFTSQLWHCSGPNTTGCSRRAFYVQYTNGIMTAQGKLIQIADADVLTATAQQQPLAFAVAC
jgi:Phytanoyl-CoA dioxygenase (PhyH)